MSIWKKFRKWRYNRKQGRRWITIRANVTEAQALALEVMIGQWNSLSSMGSSRFVAFYADGDGNFHPAARMYKPRCWRQLTDELTDAAINWENDICLIDFDPIDWMLDD